MLRLRRLKTVFRVTCSCFQTKCIARGIIQRTPRCCLTYTEGRRQDATATYRISLFIFYKRTSRAYANHYAFVKHTLSGASSASVTDVAGPDTYAKPEPHAAAPPRVRTLHVVVAPVHDIVKSYAVACASALAAARHAASVMPDFAHAGMALPDASTQPPRPWPAGCHAPGAVP